MGVSGPDYERIAMCAHPEGTHEHIPLKPGEDPPERCFADCDCEPVVFVRADLHARAVADRDRYRAALEELRGHSGGDPIRIENIIDDALIGGQ